MTGELLIGVDIGTTSTKTAVFTVEGLPLAEASAETPLQWHGPGEVDQDPDDFYSAAVKTIARCLEQAAIDARRVVAIGVDGQMAGVLGVDRDWQPSMPYDSWLDTRCAADVELLAREFGDELVERTGCPAMVNHAPKLRWWAREQPQAFARTAKFVMPSGYVAGKLVGLWSDRAFIDATHLHFTGLVDAESGSWSPELCTAVGVPEEKLPDIVEPSVVVGKLSPQAAADSTLPAGIPVAAGLGDTAAGALGAGVVHAGQLFDTAGTAAVLAASVETFRPDQSERTLIVMRGAIPGQWFSLAYLPGGSLLTWFRDAIATSNGAVSDLSYEAMSAGVDKVSPGSDGLLFVPHLGGRLLPSEPAMRGAWIGLNQHHRRVHLLRAIFESVPYEYANYLRVLLDLHPELQPKEARVVGGGARSRVWNQIKASVLSVPYIRLDRDEFACWGAALVAGHAVGLFGDLACDAIRSTAVRERYEPVPREHAVYRRMIDQYRVVVDALTGPSRVLTSMQADYQEQTREEEAI